MDCPIPRSVKISKQKHPGGRGGDLDESLWSVSRFSVAAPNEVFARKAAEGGGPDKESFCGRSDFSGILPPNDFQICSGTAPDGSSSNQLNEVMHDGENFAINSMRIRQPFDFTDRVGTIAFDVDAKRNPGWDGHGWWTEVWITKDPNPIPYHGAPMIGSYVNEGVGIQISPQTPQCFDNPDCNEAARVVISRDHKIIRDRTLDDPAWFKAKDTHPNRFRLLVSADRIEIWATDWDAPNDFRRMAQINELNLGFTVGYVHLQHSQYNAAKAGASKSQTFRWDNVGFDGPKHPIRGAYDAADARTEQNVVFMGYDISSSNKITSVKVDGLDLDGATEATFDFNLHASPGASIEYRFNGGPWHPFTVPDYGEGNSVLLRTFTVPAPLEELVAGANSIDVRPESGGLEFVGNMDITVDK